MPSSKNNITYLIPNCSLIWTIAVRSYLFSRRTDLSLKHWEWPFPSSKEFLGCSLWFTRASQLLSLLWVLKDTSQIMSPLTSKPSGGFPHDLDEKPIVLTAKVFLMWSLFPLYPHPQPPSFHSLRSSCAFTFLWHTPVSGPLHTSCAGMFFPRCPHGMLRSPL